MKTCVFFTNFSAVKCFDMMTLFTINYSDQWREQQILGAYGQNPGENWFQVDLHLLMMSYFHHKLSYYWTWSL